MKTILQGYQKDLHCVNRRSFVQIGVGAGVCLSLHGLLQAEEAASLKGSGGRKKSLIVIYLSGGMSHQDTFDMKPLAPAEIRGEFNTIQSNLTGYRLCELLPGLASRMDKLVVLRSLVGFIDEHSSFQNLTGFSMGTAQREGKPHIGSVISRALGALKPTVPAFVDLFPTMQHRPYNSPGPGLLGRTAQAVRVDGSDLGPMKMDPADLLGMKGKRALLEKIDFMRGNVDTANVDTNYKRAFDVLTSRELVNALDVSFESEKIRDRYGRGSPKHQGDGAPLWNEQLVMARRLVEAGARIVSVGYGFWDTHGNNFGHLKANLPIFDQGISALLDDLHDRGLADDTTVLIWGEFGRTPKINKDGGRDHWSRVNTAILAGGGLKTGQVIGNTDASAGEVKDDPIHYHDVLATVYTCLGIDPHGMVLDIGNRPNSILPGTATPINRILS